MIARKEDADTRSNRVTGTKYKRLVGHLSARRQPQTIHSGRELIGIGYKPPKRPLAIPLFIQRLPNVEILEEDNREVRMAFKRSSVTMLHIHYTI